MNSFPTQSALDPAGQGAESIAQLFYWMSGGAALIWCLVIGLAVYAIRRPQAHHYRLTRLLVIGGGAVVPTVVLTCLLSYGLSMMPELQRPAPEGSLTVHVHGVRWWWRVEYLGPSGQPIATANEIRLPVDQPIEFKLFSEDVIHSFWIPSLGGKVDMIPGRTTRLKLHPTRVGQFRGVCAEYCGGAHAQMNFDVVVSDAATFERWLADQSAPASEPETDLAVAGKAVFSQRGCGACHAIRGTAADGLVGPDLTHLGSRLRLGASLLDNTRQNLRRWITQTHQVKPKVEMPAFEALPEDELTALVAYLEQLK
ncbi:cytochrome c oxidase subunit II [Roseiconus nitratireducens]|uniref:Cytochrome aa3 subunit 2 n=1 Tax=Roseiconus nitratireducens TaxID=2605748 RepID=A0A5M6D9K2_9BACT|nr:cytochrome c oxidase subunit II [Roseiconus nitratireducens]KAA5542619.1 cytochrome c oxidase subunit II [Roseiconus nitratireducens]